MKLKEMKEFAREHKKEILIGSLSVAGLAIGGIFIGKGLTKYSKACKLELPSQIGKIKSTDLMIPIMDVGTIDELWMEDAENMMGIVNDLLVSDLGKFGEDLYKNVSGVTPETEVSAIISLIGIKEENVVFKD